MIIAKGSIISNFLKVYEYLNLIQQFCLQALKGKQDIANDIYTRSFTTKIITKNWKQPNYPTIRYQTKLKKTYNRTS